MAATVYRDEHGVPHIEAPTEELAWYALGYEQARDALPLLGIYQKRVRGQGARYLGAYPHIIREDVIIRATSAHLGNRTEQELRALFADPGAAKPDQFFENLSAYTRGVNAYRERFAAGQVDAVELHTRAWLDNRGMQWAYQDPLTVQDVASWGRFTVAGLYWAIAGAMDNNPVKETFVPSGGGGGGGAGAAAGGAAPGLGTADERLAYFRTFGNKGSGFNGSNGFTWTQGYSDDNGTPLGGVMADPHGPNPTFLYGYNPGGPPVDVAHAWFAHLKVNDPAAPFGTLNAFGLAPIGAGGFTISHNDNVAIGGSAGSPNISDGFLLRVRDGANGKQFYSFYLDADNDDGADDSDWEDVVVERLVIDLPNNATFQKDIWRCGRFGFVMNTTPFYAQANVDWSVGLQAPANLFSPTPVPAQGITEPVVVAYRTPMDPNVDGPAHTSKLAHAFYRVMKADNVHDIVDMINTHESGFMVDFVASDRDGRVLGTMLGTIPQRGDDALLVARGIDGDADKWSLYDKMSNTPVPARYSRDRMFDWQFVVPNDPASGVRYLRIQGNGTPSNPSHLAHSFFDPTAPGTNRPQGTVDVVDGGVVLRNPGFSTLSNDMVFHGFHKRDALELVNLPFQTYRSPDNAVLDGMLQSGTLYQTALLTFDSLEKTQAMVDQLAGIARTRAGLAGGIPPMTPDQSIRFALDTRAYAARDYPGPNGAGAIPGVADLPVRVRVLEELRVALDANPYGTNLLEQYDREVRFFRDLWSVLFAPPPGSHWEAYPVDGVATVNLRDVWVGNTAQAAFWYANPSDVGSWLPVPMPPLVGLVDFLWMESLPGTFDPTAGTLVAFDAAERAQLESAMDLLRNWDTSQTPPDQRFRREGWSRAAALVAEYELGLAAAAPLVSRTWSPLYAGAALGDAQPYLACPQAPQVVPLDPNGFPPAVNAQGQFPGGSYAQRAHEPYTRVAGFAGPPGAETWYSALGNAIPDALNVTVPFDALYDGNGAIRTVLTPQHINAFVEFFLKLGGFYVTPAPGGVPSNKLEKWNLFATACGGLPNRHAFAASYRVAYPYTPTMMRIALLRRLLETDDQLVAWFGQRPTWGDIFKARVVDFDDVQRWPVDGNGNVLPDGAPCQGESVRSATFFAEGNNLQEAVGALAQGFQRRMWCGGGSNSPLFTLFSAQGTPRSWFWTIPGQRAMHFTSRHFADLQDAYASNQPVETHFSDYAQSSSPELPTVTHVMP